MSPLGVPASALEPLADVALFLGGAALLLAVARRWREQLPTRWALAYLALVASFYGHVLATRATQTASDIPYQWRPWSYLVEPGFAPANPLLSDVPLQVVPLKALARERLLRLQPPLWAHEVGTGQPLLGNGQTAPFAPLHLLALPLPTPRALTVAVAWQTLVALLLTHLLLRWLGTGNAGAGLAAVAYAFSTFAVAWAYHPHAMVAAWLPGVLAALLQVARGGRGGLPLLVVCGVAMALSGHAETLAHGAVAAAVVTAALLARGPAIGRGALLTRLVLAGLLIGGLAAPVLLPLLEALPHGERMAVALRAPRALWPPGFAPRHLLPLVSPLAFGSPRDGNWTGPFNFNEMCSLYAGLAPLAIAVAGAAVLRGRVLAVLVGGAVALAGALAVPPFLQAWRVVPLLEHAAHARLRLLWVLAVAVAAGLGLEGLRGRRRGPAVVAVALAAAALAAALVPPPGGGWQRAWHLTVVLGALAAALVAARPLWRPALPAAAWVALVADLWLLGVRYHPAVTPRLDLAAPPAVAALVRQSAAGPPGRVVAWHADLRPNLAARYGLWDVRADDPMHPVRASGLIGRRLWPRHRPGRPFVFRRDRLDLPLLDFLAVRHALLRRKARLPPPWELAASDAGGAIWHNPRALSLFHLPARIAVARDQGQALAHTLANSNFADTAVALATSPLVVRGGAQRGRIERVRARANGFDLLVASPTGGVVASSVSAMPGWRARAGGRTLSVVEVNAAFVGVVVPAGRHRVTVDYQPAGWRWGLAIAATTGLALLAAGVVATLRRRRRGDR